MLCYVNVKSIKKEERKTVIMRNRYEIGFERNLIQFIRRIMNAVICLFTILPTSICDTKHIDWYVMYLIFRYLIAANSHYSR